jgi:hypothetical protein
MFPYFSRKRDTGIANAGGQFGMENAWYEARIFKLHSNSNIFGQKDELS